MLNSSVGIPNPKAISHTVSNSTDDVGFDWKYNGNISENETNAIIID